MKKCQKCGAPLEGFLYNTIGKLLGIKPSAKDPEMCNKCEADAAGKVEETKPAPEVIITKPEAPAAPVVPEADKDSSSAKASEDEEKDDLIS